MNIVRYRNSSRVHKVCTPTNNKVSSQEIILKGSLINGGGIMENVLVMNKYVEHTQSDENEWDIITNICQTAIKRKGLTNKEVHEISSRILNEVRAK